MVSGSALLTAPFLASSLALDEHGVTIPGKVTSKSETVTLRYSDWKRSSEVTFRYEPPDSHSVGFFQATLTPEQYDAFHVGDAVSLHYLPASDVPVLPLSKIMREMHALPMVRLADRRTFTAARQFFCRRVILALEAIAGLLIIVFILRKTRSPLFGWVVGAAVLAGCAVALFYDFPRPTPNPAADIRQTTGRVKSLSEIEHLFAQDDSRGLDTAQPVDVVGVEFVPTGRTESVVAIDLIDAGSVPGLKENSTVPIDYEANSPRTAHMQRATRKFVSKNISGIFVQGAILLAIVIVFFGICHLFGRAYRGFVARATGPTLKP